MLGFFHSLLCWKVSSASIIEFMGTFCATVGFLCKAVISNVVSRDIGPPPAAPWKDPAQWTPTQKTPTPPRRRPRPAAAASRGSPPSRLPLPRSIPPSTRTPSPRRLREVEEEERRAELLDKVQLLNTADLERLLGR